MTLERDRRPGGPSAVLGCVTLVRMRAPFLTLWLAASATLVVSCSSGDEDPSAGAPSTTEAAPTTTAANTTASTTTTEPLPQSSAVIRIGPARYELDAICAAGGAGEVEVSVAGTDVNGLPVVGYVRAFLGEPYVSLQVGTGAGAKLFEPRLEGTLPFELTDRGVTFAEVDFVTGLDLETGDFTPAGIGAVDVVCEDYVRSLPPIPFD